MRLTPTAPMVFSITHQVRVLVLGLGVCLGLAVPSQSAWAQFSVTELEVHLRPNGRGPVTGVIPVESTLDTLQQLRLVMMDWKRDSAGSNIFEPLGTLPGSCAGRLELFPATVQLRPGTTEFVRVTYTGPGLPDPGCWAAVTFERVQPPSVLPDGPSITVSLLVAAKVYVHASDAVAAGEVVSADVENVWLPNPPSRDSVQARQIALRFANTGTAHLRVKSTLEVRSQSTALLGQQEGQEAYIAPGGFRDIVIRIPDLPRGRYVAIVLLDYGAEEITAAQVDFEVP